MSSMSIPNLKLFPLYTGGPILNGKNGLNGNSQFTIPATRYSQSYSVNMQPKTSAYDPNSYYAFDSSNPRYLSSKPTGSAPAYNTMLGIDTSKPGRLAQVSAPTTAPEIPQSFQGRVGNYTITEDNYAALMAQNSFIIPGIGMGLKVTTDGNGNVASESLNPSSLGTMRRTNAVGHDLGVLNRAEITTGAIYKVNDPGYSFSNIKKGDLAAAKNKPPQTPSAVGALGSPALLQNNGIFKTQSANAAALTGADALTGLNVTANPFLAKLNQLQPQDAGLSLSGIDAEIDADQAQQVAANQADYGVNLSDNFYQNIASVVSAANSQQQNSYAATFAPRMVQAMDGRVNVTPWQMPTQANQGPLTSSNNVVGLNMGASVADATSGNAKNGYIPFNMQNGGSSSGGGFADANPFMGGGSSGSNAGAGGNAFQGGMQSGTGRQSGQQQQSFYRKPLAYSA